MMNNQATILNHSYDLLKNTLDILSRFPRDQRFLLGNRIQNLLSDLLEIYIEAYYTPHTTVKSERLQKANIQLEKLRFFIRLSFDKGYISPGQYRLLAEQIQETGRMTGGWLKHIFKKR